MSAVEAIQGIFWFMNNLVPLALSDLSNERSLKRSRGGDVPSVAWTIGYLLHCRYMAMKLLSVDRPSPYEKDFGSEGTTDGGIRISV